MEEPLLPHLENTFKGFPKKKAGYAILTNGEQGGALQGEIAAHRPHVRLGVGSRVLS